MRREVWCQPRSAAASAVTRAWFDCNPPEYKTKDGKPIKKDFLGAYDLVFERFLSAERPALPDIDIDFDDQGRDKVIEYVANKYGRTKADCNNEAFA